jgi:nicotinate-nucleotide pyrophosphorylase (carboxylating)
MTDPRATSDAAARDRVLGEFASAELERARSLIQQGLEEDVGGGDVTTTALIPGDAALEAEFVARREGILCGLPVLAELFRSLEPAIALRPLRSDGDRVRPAEAFLRISGPAQPILRGERLALNFLQRLSGIATATRKVVDSLQGTHCGLFDTRKTTPGWRVLEKYAVRMGGGKNHRLDLASAVLIKDNHRKVLARIGRPDMRAWVEQVRRVQSALPIEIEVDSVEELGRALEAGCDFVLLDNFTLEDLRRAVAVLRDWPGKKPKLEASGGITPENARAVAETGVDRISMGAITHSAPALDIGLDLVELEGEPAVARHWRSSEA